MAQNEQNSQDTNLTGFAGSTASDYSGRVARNGYIQRSHLEKKLDFYY